MKPYIVKLLPEAEIELAYACKWYNKRQTGLGGKLLNEVNSYLELIAANPLQYNVRFSNKYRFASLYMFPYFIVYRVDEDEHTVIVNAVFHTSRDPQKF
ncbi:MAG: type II toxin-antitoxin system RelE/ParE family toxin [Sphingobacteriaceae bacterium]|nr:MAG: type II toxin-antitoxin system RelE/ParE family toxin [Sphingobacteriaceae bacterium]